MKPVAVVFATLWDRKQLATLADAGADPGEIICTSPDDLDCPDDFDVLGFIDDAVGDARVAAVLSSSDYPGAVVAAAIASGRGLPGASPTAVLRCHNKFAARLAMQGAVPEATPAFGIIRRPMPIDARIPDFPFFLKPIRGAFSAHSTVVTTPAELDAFLSRPAVAAYMRDYLRLHHRLQSRYAPDLPPADAFLAEEILTGEQVTVEGFVHGGTTTILGIVDSILHPGTRSFARFEYPSALPASVQERMHDVAKRTVAALGLDHCLFNVEMTYDPATGRIAILEVNPRMCGQFADLYHKVDGTHGYAVALALARGEPPIVRRGEGEYSFAASVPLRVFAPTRVRRAPNASDIAAAEALYPGTLVWVECATGDALCDFDSIEDGASARYAVMNVGGSSRETVMERVEAVRRRIGFELEPIDDASVRVPPATDRASVRLAAEYGATARAYADYWSPVIAPMAQPVIDALASPNARCVLDLGCGTGALLPRLRQAFPQAAICGVDRSEGMLRVARATNRDRTGSGLATMDAQLLGLANEVADVALLAFVLFHLPDPLAGLREAIRVLRSGGSCGAATWAEDEEEPWNRIWREELDACGAAADPRDPSVMRHSLVDSTTKLARLFREAGFERVHVWHADFAHAWSAADLLRMQTACGTPSRRLASLTPASRVACRDRVETRLARLAPDDLVARPRVLYARGERVE